MPHIKCTHGTHMGTHHMTGHERRQPSTESCARRFVWGNKDHAKMTHAKTAPVKRGLGAKRAHTKSQSVKMMVGRVCVWAGASGARAAQRTLSRLVEARSS